MPTILGILIFMSRINSIISWDEHEKKFYNLKTIAFVILIDLAPMSFHLFGQACLSLY